MSLAEKIAALRAAGATEIVIASDGTVTAKFAPMGDTPSLPFIPAIPFVPSFPSMRPAYRAEPCLLDGLPPGAYWISCSCPRCSPRFETTMRIATTSYGPGPLGTEATGPT